MTRPIKLWYQTISDAKQLTRDIKTLLYCIYYTMRALNLPGKSDLAANNFLRDFELQSNNWKKPPT